MRSLFPQDGRARAERLGFPIACAGMLLLAGCASRSANPPATDAPSAPFLACAERTLHVPEEACADLPAGFGYSPDVALEWGDKAAAGVGKVPLYFGRLMCPDGTSAEGQRTGTTGSRVRSTSPPSKMPFTSDIIDRWEVSCGAETAVIYTNMYRCGRPCVPAPFRLLPAAAAEAVFASLEFQRDGAMDEALAYARDAAAAYPASEQVQARVVTVLRRMGRDTEAMVQASDGLRVVPNSILLRMLLAFSLDSLGELEFAAEVVDDVLERVPDSDRDYRPYALCRRGLIARELGDHENARKFMQEACAIGDDACCDH